MSEIKTGSIQYSNKQFDGPNLKNNEYEINKISCELGEIYYQTTVDEDGLTQVAPGGVSEQSNGLFITNDKIKEMISTGEISKYSWLLQLVLEGKNNFLEKAEAGTNLDLSDKAQMATYYNNGIFVPLKMDIARARCKKTKAKSIPVVGGILAPLTHAVPKITTVDKNELLFRLPYDHKFRLTLRFNQSNIDVPYDPETIQESIIEYKKDEKNRYGVKEEYQNSGINKGAFFVLNDNKDVTSHVPIVVRDLNDTNGKSVACLPTDFNKNGKIEEHWKKDEPRMMNFSMVKDSYGKLRLKMHETSLLRDIFYQFGISKGFVKQGGAAKFFDYDKTNKIFTINGKRDNPTMISNFTLKFDLTTFKVTVSSVPMAGVNDLNDITKEFNEKFLDFKSEKVANTNVNIRNLLISTKAVAKNEDFIDTSKGEITTKSYEGKDLVELGVKGLKYSDNNVRSYILESPDVKEVRLYKDLINNTTYYAEYDRTNSKLIGTLKEVGEKTFLHCQAGQSTTYIIKKDRDKLITVSTNKKINTNPAIGKTDAATILKDDEIEKFLQSIKQEHNSGQMQNVFKALTPGQSPAEKVSNKLGERLEIETNQNGVIKPICTYIPAAAGGGQPGKFVLKNGEEKPLNDIKAVKEILEKNDEEAIVNEMENDKTNVLSSGTIFDFCASQIDAVRPQEKGNENSADPIKAKAQAYLKNIQLYAPEPTYTPHTNTHMERQRKKINNASGFTQHMHAPHINKHTNNWGHNV